MTTRKGRFAQDGESEMPLRPNPFVPSMPPSGLRSSYSKLIWRAYELHYLFKRKEFQIFLPDKVPEFALSEGDSLKPLSEIKDYLDDREYMLYHYIRTQLNTITRLIIHGSEDIELASIDSVDLSEIKHEARLYSWNTKVIGMLTIFEEWLESHRDANVTDPVIEWVSYKLELTTNSDEDPTFVIKFYDEEYDETYQYPDLMLGFFRDELMSYDRSRKQNLGLIAILISRIIGLVSSINYDRNTTAFESDVMTEYILFYDKNKIQERSATSEYSSDEEVVINIKELIYIIYGLIKEYSLIPVDFISVLDDSEFKHTKNSYDFKESWLKVLIETPDIPSDIIDTVSDRWNEMFKAFNERVTDYYSIFDTYDTEEFIPTMIKEDPEAWETEAVRTWLNVQTVQLMLEESYEEEKLGNRIAAINISMDTSHNNGPMGEHVASYTGLDFPFEWDILSKGSLHPDVIRSVGEPTEEEIIQYEGIEKETEFLRLFGDLIDRFVTIENPLNTLTAGIVEENEGRGKISRIGYDNRYIRRITEVGIELNYVGRYYLFSIDNWLDALNDFKNSFINVLKSIYSRVTKRKFDWKEVPTIRTLSTSIVSNIVFPVGLIKSVPLEDLNGWKEDFKSFCIDVEDSINSAYLEIEAGQQEFEFMGGKEFTLLVRSVGQLNGITFNEFSSLISETVRWDNKVGKSERTIMPQGAFRQARKFSSTTYNALNRAYGFLGV